MQTFLRVSGFPDFPRDQVLTWKQTRGGIVDYSSRRYVYNVHPLVCYLD